MSYRTLEEKFLADFEELEKQNRNMRDRIDELEDLLEKEKSNIKLDAMVRVEGRKKVFDAILGWRRHRPPEIGQRSFDEWCVEWLDSFGDELKGVSYQEIIDYFNDEFVREYEEKCEAEANE